MKLQQLHVPLYVLNEYVGCTFVGFIFIAPENPHDMDINYK